MSIPALGLIQWVPGSLSAGVMWLGHEADKSPTSVPRSRTVNLYLHFYVRPHGILLNSLGMVDDNKKTVIEYVLGGWLVSVCV
jgi:hypothetical protein